MTEKRKIELVREQSKSATGICFSEGMKKKIGLESLEVVLPAHDSIPRRPRIIAIATNLYPDGRKIEKMFIELVRSLKDQKKFAFRIMGKGWKETLDKLKKYKVEVQWLPEFMWDYYRELLATSDYLLYTGGEDALAQSIIDAKQSGLRIIAPPQEDLTVDLPFVSQKDLNYIFAQIEENEVEDWTWDNYAKAHINIWKKLK